VKEERRGQRGARLLPWREEERSGAVGECESASSAVASAREMPCGHPRFGRRRREGGGEGRACSPARRKKMLMSGVCSLVRKGES
jgi:hypothetical protein